MGATAAFQVTMSTPDELVYLLTGDGAGTTTTVITDTGAATPDLVTDVLAAGFTGPLRACARAKLDGLGTLAAGTAITQALARAIFNSDGVKGGNALTPSLKMSLEPRTGVAAWSVDANATANNAVIEVTTSAAAGTALLRIRVGQPLR